MNIISFSLYGHNILYLEGIIINIELANKLLPKWKCRIYYKDIPDLYLQKILLYDVEIIEINNLFEDDNKNYSYYKMARYLPLSDKTINKFIVMDADGRICNILKDIINKWDISKKTLYFCIHADDNIICGGLWGCKGGIINNIDNIFREYIIKQFNLFYQKLETGIWGLDQRWLSNNYLFDSLIKKNDYISFIDRTAPHYRDLCRYNSEQLPLSDNPFKLFNCTINDISNKHLIMEKDYSMNNNNFEPLLNDPTKNEETIKKLYPNYKF
jgi:hypothetical protein